MENPFRRTMERRRAELGLSQAEAATRAGVARSTWSSWENSPEFPRMENWKIIAEVLQMPVERLMQLASLAWLIQVGMTPDQLIALKAAGTPLDETWLDYVFEDQTLAALSGELDVEIDPTDLKGKRLFWLRGQLRRLLIQQDTFIKTLSDIIYWFHDSYVETVTKPKRYQVRKKGEVGEIAGKFKTKKRKKVKLSL